MKTWRQTTIFEFINIAKKQIIKGFKMRKDEKIEGLKIALKTVKDMYKYDLKEYLKKKKSDSYKHKNIYEYGALTTSRMLLKQIILDIRILKRSF